jgi:diaminopimelate decarboxylase
MHHHLAASGNFGRAQLGNYPIAIGNKISQQAREEVAVVGRLCTPLDRFAERVALPPAEVGDFVVIFQSGAYARSASPGDFISHPEPRELLI